MAARAGKAAARRGDLEQAEYLAREAVTMTERTDYLELTAEAHAGLAEVLQIASKREESASALGEAIRLYEEKGNLVAADRVRSRLAEARIGFS